MRRADAASDDGFSLVEVLVVVIIIGILAAIAIPIYLGVQSGAKDAAVRQDLSNAKTAVAAYYADKPPGTTPPAPTLTSGTAAPSLGGYGYTRSGSTTSLAFKTTPTVTAYCIDGVSSTGATFFVSTSTSVAAGTCP